MNIQLLLQVRERILANPENYNQLHLCGTVCCIAGHMVAIADWACNYDRIEIYNRAEELLGTPARGLFGTGLGWPVQYFEALRAARTAQDKAQVAADAIIDFIITDGWTKEADLSKLLLAEPSTETAELIGQPS